MCTQEKSLAKIQLEHSNSPYAIHLLIRLARAHANSLSRPCQVEADQISQDVS